MQQDDYEGYKRLHQEYPSTPTLVMWYSSSNNLTSVTDVSAQLALWKLNYIKKGAHVFLHPPLLVS
jgi:hypothetical protein